MVVTFSYYNILIRCRLREPGDEATEVCVFTVVGRRVVVLYTGKQA